MEVVVQKKSKSARRRANRARRANNNNQPAVNVNVNGGGQSRRRRNRRRRGRTNSGKPKEFSYLESLTNPELVAGVKIPDIVAFPTGTFQVAADGYLIGGGGTGDSALMMVKPIIGNGSSTYPIVTKNGATANSTGTVTNVNWGSRAAIIAMYGGFRPVSGSVELEFVGSSSSDAGTLWASLVPSSGYESFSPTTVTAAQAVPNTEIVPLRNGIQILWKPEDSSNFDFVGTDGGLITYPMLIVGVTGVTPANLATNWVRYHVVFNFEATALVDTLSLVHTEPSPFDMNQIRGAFEWASQVGNNIFTLYQNAGPYIAAASTIANGLGWTPLPQRAANHFQGRRRRLMN